MFLNGGETSERGREGGCEGGREGGQGGKEGIASGWDCHHLSPVDSVPPELWGRKPQIN